MLTGAIALWLGARNYEALMNRTETPLSAMAGSGWSSGSCVACRDSRTCCISADPRPVVRVRLENSERHDLVEIWRTLGELAEAGIAVDLVLPDIGVHRAVAACPVRSSNV
jgi:hypothetical protein